MSSAHSTQTTSDHIRPQAAVIMAAGKGTRMRSKISKILHRVAGETIIERAVGAALAAGIDRVVVVVGHQAQDVRSTLEARFPDADLRWALQAEQRGTAHTQSNSCFLLRPSDRSETILGVPGQDC